MNTSRYNTRGKRRRVVHLKRMAVAILSAVLLAGLGYGFVYAGDSTEGLTESQTKYYKSIVIEQGDNLWDIAKVYMDSHYDCVEDYIEELRKTNGLSSETIHSGQHLLVACYK